MTSIVTERSVTEASQAELRINHHFPTTIILFQHLDNICGAVLLLCSLLFGSSQSQCQAKLQTGKEIFQYFYRSNILHNMCCVYARTTANLRIILFLLFITMTLNRCHDYMFRLSTRAFNQAINITNIAKLMIQYWNGKI